MHTCRLFMERENPLLRIMQRLWEALSAMPLLERMVTENISENCVHSGHSGG